MNEVDYLQLEVRELKREMQKLQQQSQLQQDVIPVFGAVILQLADELKLSKVTDDILKVLKVCGAESNILSKMAELGAKAIEQKMKRETKKEPKMEGYLHDWYCPECDAYNEAWREKCISCCDTFTEPVRNIEGMLCLRSASNRLSTESPSKSFSF